MMHFFKTLLYLILRAPELQQQLCNKTLAAEGGGRGRCIVGSIGLAPFFLTQGAFNSSVTVQSTDGLLKRS